MKNRTLYRSIDVTGDGIESLNSKRSKNRNHYETLRASQNRSQIDTYVSDADKEMKLPSHFLDRQKRNR